MRNVVFENIESQVSSSIPSPKVTPRRQEDEALASKIEHFLRNELDRLPFETMNDQAERTVPIQGGARVLGGVGQPAADPRHRGRAGRGPAPPEAAGAAAGIYTGIEDMDWIIVRQPTTKEAIRRQYGVDVENEGEQEPEVRGTGDEDTADDAVTEYIGYAKNDDGGIDRYTWVNDIELEDLENYQARRVPVCAHCGRVRPLLGQIIQNRPAVAQAAAEAEAAAEVRQQIAGRGPGYADGGGCGRRPPRGHGSPGGGRGGSGAAGGRAGAVRRRAVPMVWEHGMDHHGTGLRGGGPAHRHLLPASRSRENTRRSERTACRPWCPPRSLLSSGHVPRDPAKECERVRQLLGNSDVDMIEDQQNTINRMEKKIIDRLVKAGTRITMPADARLRRDPRDGEVWYLNSPGRQGHDRRVSVFRGTCSTS